MIIDKLTEHIAAEYNIWLTFSKNVSYDTYWCFTGLFYEYDRGKFSEFINYESYELSVLWEIERFLKINNVNFKSVRCLWYSQELEIILNEPHQDISRRETD